MLVFSQCMTDVDFMKQALQQAQRAFAEDEVPVGAVIVLNHKIIARGYNQVEKLSDPTAHAEIIALTSAFNFLGSKYLPEATIYITVEPCLMCAGALYWSKIGRVVYGAYDEKNGYRKYCKCPPTVEGVDLAPYPFHPRTELLTGVLQDQCSTLMKEFFKMMRK